MILLSNKFLKELGLVTFILRHLLVRKGVIQGVPLDVSMTEITEELNNELWNKAKDV